MLELKFLLQALPCQVHTSTSPRQQVPTAVRGPHANTLGQVLLGGYPTPPPPSKRPEKHGTPDLLCTIKKTENRTSGDDENPRVTNKP